MIPTGAEYIQRLLLLVDADNFTASRNLRQWLNAENLILLAQLCAIVNLLSAQQGLSKAVLLVKPTKDRGNVPSLKEYHTVRENAKGVLDTMKLVNASLEKGLMMARAGKNTSFQDDISLLEFSESHISYCVGFWKSDRIYDPLEISSFVGKIIELYDNNSEAFGGYHVILNCEEGQKLQALIDSWKRLSRQVHSHKDDSDATSIHSTRSQSSHRTGWSILKPQIHIFDHLHLLHAPHVHLDGLFHHLPHLTLPQLHSNLLHMPKPSIQLHLPNVLVDHFPHVNTLLTSPHGLSPRDVAQAIHHFLNLSAHDSHDYGTGDTDPGTLAKATQLTLQKVLKWCDHCCQSPSSRGVLKKISEETINYAYALDQSVGTASKILEIARDALSIHHKPEELTSKDIQNLYNLSLSASKEQERSSQLFNILDQDIYDLLRKSKDTHDQEKHLVDDRFHEFEHNNKALELLKTDVEHYIDWWVKASMDFQSELASCDPTTLSDSVLRKISILDKWKKIRGYFTEYPKKIEALKETFHDLFEKTVEHVPRLNNTR